MSIATAPRIAAATVVLALNTVLHAMPLLLIALLKAMLPWQAPRRLGSRVLAAIAESWIGVNNALIRRLTRTRIEIDGCIRIDGSTDLRRDGRYLVLANHQSWTDIPVLQYTFNRRIPLLRFFLKSELFWVPVLGLAWWALDFPFMKRYSRAQIARRPELAGRDIEATRRACARFRTLPVAVMNFVEGTRYSAAKHAAQDSPYAHLLRPKAGGVALVLGAMGESLQAILDVTLVYDHAEPRLADLLGGRAQRVRVVVRERAIPAEFVGADYAADADLRERFQQWLNALWRDKDALIGRLRENMTQD